MIEHTNTAKKGLKLRHFKHFLLSKILNFTTKTTKLTYFWVISNNTDLASTVRRSDNTVSFLISFTRFFLLDGGQAFHCPYTQTLSLQSLSSGKSNEEIHTYFNKSFILLCGASKSCHNMDSCWLLLLQMNSFILRFFAFYFDKAWTPLRMCTKYLFILRLIY